MQLKATLLKFDAEAKILEFEIEFVPATEAEHGQIVPLILGNHTDIGWEQAQKPNPDHLAAKFVLHPVVIGTALPGEADEAQQTT